MSLYYRPQTHVKRKRDGFNWTSFTNNMDILRQAEYLKKNI